MFQINQNKRTKWQSKFKFEKTLKWEDNFAKVYFLEEKNYFGLYSEEKKLKLKSFFGKITEDIFFLWKVSRYVEKVMDLFKHFKRFFYQRSNKVTWGYLCSQENFGF